MRPFYIPSRAALKNASLQRSEVTPVSRACREGFEGGHKDPLIGLGSAPLDDIIFRSAVFEQLEENKLEAAVTTDICGRKEAHAIRLDADAVDSIKKAHLHRKVASATRRRMRSARNGLAVFLRIFGHK
jgi:hypothetical protein